MLHLLHPVTGIKRVLDCIVSSMLDNVTECSDRDGLGEPIDTEEHPEIPQPPVKSAKR